MTHSARATAALQALTEADPALAALALWCRHRDADRLPPLAETAGSVIRYGPGFAALPAHEQIGLAGHHILHVALQHSDRMAAMEARMGAAFAPDLWQIAADAIVNETILQAGHALPRPALRLGEVLGTLGEQTEGALAEWDCERLYGRLAGAADAAGRVRAQAQQSGHQPDLRPEAAQEGNAGDDKAEQGRAEWRAHLARAMAAGRGAGFGVGVLGARLADLPTPRVPWEHLLRRLLARATLPRPTVDPLRPARGWLAGAARAQVEGRALPPFQPRIRWQGPGGRVVLALDCSTSVTDDSLRLMMAEIHGIARRHQAALHLLSFDAAIHHDMALDPATARATLAALELPQGGGTDFRPVLARAVALAPSALVILSDMDGPFGELRPRFPVIWAAPQPDPPEAPFGRVLSLAV